MYVLPMPDQDADAVFSALAASERRRLLAILTDHSPSETVAFATLQSTLVDEPEHTHDRDVCISLFHVHLPLLEDHGFVRWDPETNEIGRGPRFDDLEPMLDGVDDGRLVDGGLRGRLSL